MTKILFSPFGPVQTFLGDLRHAVGKTIQSVCEERTPSYSYSIIRFTDGSAFALADSEGETLSEGETFDLPFQEVDRVYFGLADAKQYAAKRAKKDEERNRAVEQADRKLYETLKARFGD